MYCSNCGSKVDDDALFCTNCGSKIEDIESEPEKTSYLNDAFKQEKQAANNGRQAGESMPDPGVASGNTGENAVGGNTAAGYAGAAADNTGSAPNLSMTGNTGSFFTQGNAGAGTGQNQQPARDPMTPPDDMAGKNKSARPPKKGKGGIIALIIIIAVLCVAIIGGAVVFVLMQRNRSEKISAFQKTVEDFEEFLDGTNYSSIQDEVNALLEKCQQTIEDKSVKSIEALEQEMDSMKSKLEGITESIGSLEDLKNTYQSMLDENYYIPEELQQSVNDILANVQTAIDNGAGDQLENLKSQLDEMIQGIKDKDMELIESYKNNVMQMDLSGALEDEKASLNNYLNEIQQLIDSQSFKAAIEKAKAYEDYAKQVADKIKTRQEESRRESEEEAARNDYICPESNSRYLTEADLAGLSSWELLLARNEIYARHGRMFDDPDIRAYFESKSWYQGTVSPESFNTNVFNKYELANIDFIQKHEN